MPASSIPHNPVTHFRLWGFDDATSDFVQTYLYLSVSISLLFIYLFVSFPKIILVNIDSKATYKKITINWAFKSRVNIVQLTLASKSQRKTSHSKDL